MVWLEQLYYLTRKLIFRKLKVHPDEQEQALGSLGSLGSLDTRKKIKKNTNKKWHSDFYAVREPFVHKTFGPKNCSWPLSSHESAVRRQLDRCSFF